MVKVNNVKEIFVTMTSLNKFPQIQEIFENFLEKQFEARETVKQKFTNLNQYKLFDLDAEYVNYKKMMSTL